MYALCVWFNMWLQNALPLTRIERSRDCLSILPCKIGYKVYYIEPKPTHFTRKPAGQKAEVCPVCGHDDLEYGDSGLLDESYVYK